MITVLLILIPLLSGIIACFFKDKKVESFALGASILEFILSIYAFFCFKTGNLESLVFNTPWISKFGISFYIDIDGISLLMTLLTTFLIPLIILSARGRNYSKPGLFYGLILAMQAALIGVFVAKDAFLFYIFWELTLIPIYFIILLWGGAEKLKVTFKFFIYTLFGSMFMLLGIIYLYLQTGPDAHTFSIDAFYNLQLSSGTQMWIFWAFFLAFAIKLPIFPFHTWQPDTYTVSPMPGTMLLSGIMLKMGIYGIIRWMIPIVPYAILDKWGGSLAIILCVIGIIYASIIAILQNDFKRLIAYASIAHIGLIAAGVFTLSFEGLQGGVLQMLAHGINVIGLFFIIEIIAERTNTRKLSELGGIRTKAPQLATFFVIIVFSSISIPLTAGFSGEFLLFVGLFKYNFWIAGVACLSIVLGAVYMLYSFQKAMLGNTSEKTSVFQDLKFNEKAVLIPIVILIFLIGIYPKVFLSVSEPAVHTIIQEISNTYTLK